MSAARVVSIDGASGSGKSTLARNLARKLHLPYVNTGLMYRALTAAAIRERGRPGIPSPLRAVLDFGASFLRPMGYDYFDWQDLRPAARATADFTRSTLGKMLGREPTSLRRQSRELREGDEDAATVRARRAV